MNTNTTTQGAAAGSSGFALAVSSIVIWILSLKNISVPADVATAFVTVFAIITHFVVSYFTPKNQDINVPIPAAPAAAVIVPVAEDPALRDRHEVLSNTSEALPAATVLPPDNRNRPAGH